MGDALLLWLPLAALIVLFASGAGLTTLLAHRLPSDAQLALAAPLGAAVLVCASTALHLGAPIRATTAVALSVSVGVTARYARRVGSLLRSALVPLLVAAIALGVVATPLAARGNWDAAALDNADPYIWVSQAKSLLDGPPPGPAAAYPDAIAYQRIQELHWPVALPAAVAQIALLARADPSSSYGAFAALLAVLLALSVYACTRACLDWSKRVSAVAAGAVSANALLLYSTFNGWQAQIALTMFGTLSLFMLRLALEDRGRREQALAGLFVAAAAATYSVAFGFFAALLAVVVGAYVASHRPVPWRRVGSVLVGVGAVAAGLGAVPLVRMARLALAGSGFEESPAWAGYARGLPPEMLGLIPRIGTAMRPPAGWTLLASIATIGLLVLVLMAATRRYPRRDVLLGTCGACLLAIGLLQWPGASPYLSIKFAGYSAPLVTMLAVGLFATGSRLPRTRVAVVGAAACCFAFSTGIIYQETRLHLQTLEPLKPLGPALTAVPKDARIGVALRDGWNQSWALYFLRGHRLVVLEPTDYLTGFGYGGRKLPTGNYEYLVDYASADPATWKSAGLVLVRMDGEPAEERALSFSRAGREP